MQKKSILFVIDNMNIGGIQKNMLNLLIALQDRFDLTLCVFNAVGSYMERIPASVRIIEPKHAFHYLGMSNAEAKKHPLTFLCRTFYYAVMRCFGNKAMYRLMEKLQKPLGTYDFAVSGMQAAVAGVFYSGANEFVLDCVHAAQKIAYIHCDFVQSGIDNPYNRTVYRRLDKILVPNRSNYEQLLAVMPELRGKVFIVNNFCNYDEVREKADTDTVVYDASGINIVTVARISPEKGVDRAIKVMQRLKAEGFRFTYHVVGGGGDYAQLCAEVEQNGLQDTIFLHGYDSNPYRYLKHADLFLLPSRNEAAGLVIDEARSLGVPVLSTKTVAAEETLAQHQCGWVCENTDAGIYDGLKRLLQEPEIIREKAADLRGMPCNNDLPTAQFCAMLMGEGKKKDNE